MLHRLSQDIVGRVLFEVGERSRFSTKGGDMMRMERLSLVKVERSPRIPTTLQYTVVLRIDRIFFRVLAPMRLLVAEVLIFTGTELKDESGENWIS